MYGQVLQAHVNRHAKAESEQAEEDADEQKFVAVDGAVEKADLGKIGQLEGSFAAGSFAGRLSQGSSRAHGKQRGHNRKILDHAASQKRSSGEPGTHNESSEDVGIRNLRTC